MERAVVISSLSEACITSSSRSSLKAFCALCILAIERLRPAAYVELAYAMATAATLAAIVVYVALLLVLRVTNTCNDHGTVVARRLPPAFLAAIPELASTRRIRIAQADDRPT